MNDEESRRNVANESVISNCIRVEQSDFGARLSPAKITRESEVEISGSLP